MPVPCHPSTWEWAHPPDSMQGTLIQSRRWTASGSPVTGPVIWYVWGWAHGFSKPLSGSHWLLPAVQTLEPLLYRGGKQSMTKRQRIKTCQRRGCEGRRTRPIRKGFLSKPNPCTLHLGPRDKPIRFLLLSYSAYGTQTGESIVRKPIYIFFLSKLIGVTLVNKIIYVSSVQFYNITSSA